MGVVTSAVESVVGKGWGQQNQKHKNGQGAHTFYFEKKKIQESGANNAFSIFGFSILRRQNRMVGGDPFLLLEQLRLAYLAWLRASS